VAKEGGKRRVARGHPLFLDEDIADVIGGDMDRIGDPRKTEDPVRIVR
jgi:hypothetical protein